VARRKAPKAPPNKRRWLRYAIVIGLLLVFVIVYETGQQLRRAPTDSEEAAAPSAEDTPRKLKSYYQSHDLPPSWEVGEIGRAESGAVEVPVYFSPSLQNRRYGQAARPGEINADNVCPTEESGLWADLADDAFSVLVNDKTGLVDRVSCFASAAAAGGMSTTGSDEGPNPADGQSHRAVAGIHRPRGQYRPDECHAGSQWDHRRPDDTPRDLGVRARPDRASQRMSGRISACVSALSGPH
jgi:hypothetical protein